MTTWGTKKSLFLSLLLKQIARWFSPQLKKIRFCSFVEFCCYFSLVSKVLVPISACLGPCWCRLDYSTNTKCPVILPPVAVEQTTWKHEERVDHFFLLSLFFLMALFLLLRRRALTEGRVRAAENLPKQSFICHGPDEKQREHQCAV